MRALDFDFTDYLFVDSDHRATEALLHRIGSHPRGSLAQVRPGTSSPR